MVIQGLLESEVTVGEMVEWELKGSQEMKDGVLMEYQATRETLVNLGLQVHQDGRALEEILVEQAVLGLKVTMDSEVLKVREEDPENLDFLDIQA